MRITSEVRKKWLAVGKSREVTVTPNTLHISSAMDFFSDIAGGNPYKPSLFELVAQEQLRDLLQPALKYVLTVRRRRSAGYTALPSTTSN